MTSDVLNRTVRRLLLRFVGVALGLACSATRAGADSIVIANDSYIFGVVLVAGQEQGFSTADRIRLPLTGSGTLSDVVTGTVGGATAHVISSLTSNLQPDRLGSAGHVSAIASATAAASAAGVGFPQFDVTFRLFEPHAYSYEGIVSLPGVPACCGGDSYVEAMVGLSGPNLDSPTSPDVVFTYGLLRMLEDVEDIRQYSGVLGAGDYRFSTWIQVGSLTSPSNPGELALLGDFNVALELAPIGAVPEPTTLALFGTGLAGLAARAWRRKRRTP